MPTKKRRAMISIKETLKNGDKMLTAEQAAEILNIKPKTMTKRFRCGVIDGIKDGKRWLTTLDAIDRSRGVVPPPTGKRPIKSRSAESQKKLRANGL